MKPLLYIALFLAPFAHGTTLTPTSECVSAIMAAASSEEELVEAYLGLLREIDELEVLEGMLERRKPLEPEIPKGSENVLLLEAFEAFERHLQLETASKGEVLQTKLYAVLQAHTLERRENSKETDRARRRAKKQIERVIVVNALQAPVGKFIPLPFGGEVLVCGVNGRCIHLGAKGEKLGKVVIGGGRGIYAYSFSPDHQHLALAISGGTPSVRVYDTQSWKEVSGHAYHEGLMGDVSFSADGKYVYSVSYGIEDVGYKWDWRANEGTELPRFPGQRSIIQCSPDGKYIFSKKDHDLTRFEISTGREESIEDLGVHGEQFWISKDGKEFLSVGSMNGMHFTRGQVNAAPELLQPFTTEDLIPLSTMGVAPDLKRVAIATFGGRGESHSLIKVFDDLGKTSLIQLKGHKFGIKALGFSWDGNQIYSGDEEGIVRIWDLEAYMEEFYK